MDQSKMRRTNQFRKTSQKPPSTGIDSYPTPAQSPMAQHETPMWDFNSLNPYFSMLNMNDGINYARHQQNHIVTSRPPTPLTDLMSLRSFQSFPNVFMPVSRSRTSSFIQSDTDSSRLESDDFSQNVRCFSADIDRSKSYGSSKHYHLKYSRPALSRNSRSFTRSNNVLPTWSLDSNGEMRSRLSLSEVLDSGDLMKFAVDKTGCQFLEKAVKGSLTSYQKFQLFEQVIGRKDDFLKLSTNIFGNYLVQSVIGISLATNDDGYTKRQEKLKNFISSQMTDMCLDKFACRVIQSSLQNMDLSLACKLVQALPRDARLIAICVDQNANHVIQKVVAVIPLKNWEFIVDFVATPEHLRQICSDKYGCRVVQTIIEKLTADSMNVDLTSAAQNLRERALQRLMTSVTNRCQELATNEYANYIIQHIVSNDDLAVYRECIIEKCLMRNLLSLSQEKFASHVVEKAFLHAPLELLAEMMDEIFDGYIPHPDTGKDALDIMMFHQFGNYVVQCMLTICCDAVSGRRQTKEGGYDHAISFQDWLKKLHSRVTKERHRLSRFSSGKKMIETLANLRSTHPIYELQSSGHDSFKTDYFSTASEHDGPELEKNGIEEGSLMLEPRSNKSSVSVKFSSSGSHGDD